MWQADKQLWTVGKFSFSTNQATMTFFARSMAIGMLAGAPDTMPELAFRRKRKWKPRLSKHNHRPVIGPSKYISIFFRLL